MALAFFGIVIIIASFVMRGLHTQTSDKINLKPLEWLTRVVGVLFVIGGVLWGGVVQIPAGYQGVKLRFGAVDGTLPPGIHLIVPGINRVELMETRTQKEQSQASAASRDLQIVTTTLALNYRIDPTKVDNLYSHVGPLYRERVIDPSVQESLKVVTSRYTAEELIRNRAQVKSEVEAEIIKRLQSYDIMVDPQGLSIVNFDFSPEFNKAIETKQVAQQEAEKQKYVLQQAELQKQTEVTRAEGNAQAAKLNAAALQVSGGTLVIAREWIEKWDGKLPSVSAGGGGAGGGQFIIDLSTLMKQAP
ncbi:MAG: prohibitin family protein [Fimbriimonadaceae bacterium]|nr:prohibitin family protein [Fimbriimonadaceae bacterium]